MSNSCDSCQGLEPLTPLEISNRPSLEAIHYRVGTHGAFLETMKARLSSLYVELPPEGEDAWLLKAADLANPARLVGKLQAAKDALSQKLNHRFSPDFKQKLAAYNKHLPLSNGLRQALLTELNQLLAQDWSKEENGAEPEPKTNGANHVRPNRLSLEAAYPYELKPRQYLYPLHDLTTRETSDPTLALLDAWASVADILTFYQERIANEGYLRTATERRSILELAALVGYQLRPGLAASVYLAFTVEDGFIGTIPAGTRVQSLPGPGELPQSFETSEDLPTRAVWNAMKPRLSQPQVMEVTSHTIFLQGLQANLKPNDPALVIDATRSGSLQAHFRRVFEFEPEMTNNRTKVFLRGDLSLGNLISKAEIIPLLPVKQVDPPTNPDPRHQTMSNQPLNSFTLSWLGSASSSGPVTYTLAIGINEEPLVKIINIPPPETPPSKDEDVVAGNITYEKGGGISYKFDSKPDWLVAGVTYRWQVTATDEISTTPSQVWQFTTNGTVTNPPHPISDPPVTSPPYDDKLKPEDQKRKEAITKLLSKIRARLGSAGDINLSRTDSAEFGRAEDLPLLRRLGNRNLSADELTKYIEIEQPALEGVKTEQPPPDGAEGILDIIARLLNYPDSKLDFSYVLTWVQDVKEELKAVLAQLKLLRSGQITGRIFKDKAINSQNIPEIITHISALPDTISPSPMDDEDLKQLKKELNKVAGFLLNASNSEDDKIVAVEATIRRVGDTQVFFKELWPDQATLFQLLLLSLRNTIIKLEEEPEQPSFSGLVSQLQTSPSRPPAHPLQLARDISDIFAPEADMTTRLLTTFQPQLKETFYQAWAKFTPHSLPQGLEVLQVKATPFGSKVPSHKTVYTDGSDKPTYQAYQFSDFNNKQAGNLLTLDAEYDKIVEDSWVVIEWPENEPATSLHPDTGDSRRLVRRVVKVQTISEPNYGKLTQLILDKDWLLVNSSLPLSVLRHAVVYAQSEALTLAEKPEEAEIQGDNIELDGLYQGLEAGRWLIVSGERTDVSGTSGAKASELVMLAGVRHSIRQFQTNTTKIDLPGDTPHTTLVLANALAYTYKRDTVTIYGNVVKATHGETRKEVLGSGNGSQAGQSFTLKQKPLTYLAAATPAGAESTLEVRVNDIRWHETENLVQLEAGERGYITRTDDEGKTTITFGDGQHGARLPTGVENIKAHYRNGLGKAGNVAPERISMLVTRPLGAKGVINPQPATGGADPERRDQARRNVPLALLALDRLVSLQDYEDFTRHYAGIDKASAVQLNDGRRDLIHLTIAGVDDIPIGPTSDLHRGLREALYRFGHIPQPVEIASRELMLLIISAGIRLHPDYLWEVVEPQIRQALLDTFSFERRDLGQDVWLSEVISAIQQVPGVVYTDVDALDHIAENTPHEELQKLAKVLGKSQKPEPRIRVETAQTQAQHVVTRSIENWSSVATRYGINEVELRQLNQGRLKDTDFDKETGNFNLKVNLLIPARIRPAQLAYLSPEVPDTLILKELK